MPPSVAYSAAPEQEPNRAFIKNPSAAIVRRDASGSTAHDDEKVKPNRRKSVHRDAYFHLESVYLTEPLASPASEETSVNDWFANLFLPGSSPSASTLPSSLNLSCEKSRRFSRGYAVTPALFPTRYKTPAHFRDLSDPFRLIWFNRALHDMGPTQTFTLNLSPEIEAAARKQSSPCDWLRRRIARELQNALNRPIDFFVTIEESDDRRLHCHGTIGIAEEDAHKARAALRRAGGEWKRARQHQSKTKPDPDDAWATYIAKDHWKMTDFARDMLRGSKSASGFDGEWFGATNAVRTRAGDLYEFNRQEYLHVMKALRALN